jgi:purine-nucleoside phosphorylase
MIDTSMLRKSAAYIREKAGGSVPKSAVVLGSGLGNFTDQIQNPVTIGMADIPGYPSPTVEGHGGKIVLGTVIDPATAREVSVITFQGRIHYYECGDLTKVLYPIFVMKELGIEILLATNAAGGINKQFKPGDLMIIRDQLNLTFKQPFFIPDHPAVGRSVPASLYDERLIRCIEEAALENRIMLRNGVYVGDLGPSYETPAEIQMMYRMGADAVGMSTVLEILQANLLGIKTAGISCITNYAAGIGNEKLSHEDVTVTAAKVNQTFITLLRALLTHPDWHA